MQSFRRGHRLKQRLSTVGRPSPKATYRLPGWAEVVGISSLRTDNLGDLVSSPVPYLPALRRRAVALDAGWLRKVAGADGEEGLFRLLAGRTVILGGGGLLSFDGHNKYSVALDLLRKYAELGNRVILWGVGHNRYHNFEEWHSKMAPNSKYPNLDAFHVGVRDDVPGFRWVPCASALSGAFDRSYRIAQPVVVYLHGLRVGDIKEVNGLPTRLNTSADYKGRRTRKEFHKIVEFLASGETIVTNSYHGAFWGQLLGRRVIAVPNSSKFLDFKHPLLLAAGGGWRGRFLEEAQLARGVQSLPCALEDARDANLGFARAHGFG